jgi:hypothetical protein
MLLPCVTSAQGASSEASSERNSRSEVFLGFQSWDELSQLTPSSGGSFDTIGFNLGGAFHWSIREQEGADLMAGLDFALFSNDSNIHHIREDLISRGLYITPSMKWLFDDGDGPRYALDFGLGYYLVDIAEVELYDFGGYSEDELWEDSAFGAYIGGSVDFPSERSNRGGGFSASMKVHFFNLGNVGDEGVASFFTNTLGTNAGKLTGPVIMFQFGYHWN